ncbi:unnamed protein product [Trichobilharzia szidati]|nr:unnamed protein product [Trichobilharzia szidati]
MDAVHRLRCKFAPELVFDYCLENGLIARSKTCQCGGVMRIHRYTKCIDGYVYRCKDCRCRKSVRDDTFFSKSHLPLGKILMMCHNWVIRRPVTATAYETEMSEVSAVQWYQYCRDVASWKMNKLTQVLGGVGVTVHVDETVLIKRKYNRGRMASNQQWVLGIYDTTLHKGYIEAIPDRSANVLLPIIQRLVLPGTTIYTDEWSSYSQLSNLGYIHEVVNHTTGFINPFTGTHTNSIESFWSHLKKRIRSVNGSRNPMIYSYLDEFMYRTWFNMTLKTPMSNWDFFLQHIRERYPL